MNRFIMPILAVALVGLVSTVSGYWEANAQSGVKVGLLRCDTVGGTNFIIGSTTDLSCIYSPVDGDRIRYRGKINTYGIDLNFKKSAVMLWSVVAPARNISPGALTGDYAGARAGASVGVGVGANVLIGGGKDSITLQPVSLEGLSGLNLAAGVATMSLHMVR